MGDCKELFVYSIDRHIVLLLLIILTIGGKDLMLFSYSRSFRRA